MKKAQLTINTIIVAALAVTVLVILFAIFTGKIKILPEQTAKTQAEVEARTCSAQGGYCVQTRRDCPGDSDVNQEPRAGWLDCSSKSFCCIPPEESSFRKVI